MTAVGFCLEDFKLGERITTRNRTVTETDIVMCSAISGDWDETHADAEYMKRNMGETYAHGQRVAHGFLIIAIAVGLSMQTKEGSQGLITALIGFDNVRFTAPVFIGDTIRVETEVIEARPSKSKPGQGILKLRKTVKNQKDETVLTWDHIYLVRART